MGLPSPGDQLFEKYLVQCDYDPLPEHEPDLGVSDKRVDYVIERDGHKCLCEVKEFAKSTSSFPGEGPWSAETSLKPVRSQIHEGARKLRSFQVLGCPLVVVLTNPHKAGVRLGTQEIIWAMEGDPEMRLLKSTEDSSDVWVSTVGRNGELRNDHSYLTAVAVLRQWLQEGELSIDLFLPKPDEDGAVRDVFFRGPKDRVFEYSFEKQAYRQVYGG